MEKNFYDPIDFDMKQYEEIKNLTTGPGEGYNTGYFIFSLFFGL